MIVDASRGHYVLATHEVPDPPDLPPGGGVRVHEGDEYLVVTTLGRTDDKRVELTVDYEAHLDGASVDETLERWPGEVWRKHTARAVVTVSEMLTLRTSDGKTIELTPAGGRFGLAVFARIMAPGEWPPERPQEHHLLVLWPLSPEVPHPSGDLPRVRTSTVQESTTGVSIGAVSALFENGVTPLIRADFTDDAAWERVVAALTKPVGFGEGDGDDDGYVPSIEPIDEAAFQGLDVEELGRAYDEDRVGYVLIADDRSMADEHDLTVLYVDLYDEPGRSFRCAVDEVASIEANLAVANMDFEDFADHLDAGGVFRGFRPT